MPQRPANGRSSENKGARIVLDTEPGAVIVNSSWFVVIYG